MAASPRRRLALCAPAQRHHPHHYEVYPDPNSAIDREKQLKGWSRVKKEKLISTLNPEWRDLGEELFRRE